MLTKGIIIQRWKKAIAKEVEKKKVEKEKNFARVGFELPPWCSYQLHSNQ